MTFDSSMITLHSLIAILILSHLWVTQYAKTPSPDRVRKEIFLC